MTTPNLLPRIESLKVPTSRLRVQHLLASGAPDGVPVVFIHGNVSSSRFYEETLAAMPQSFRCLAPDLRGFGETERAPIDATRGVGDFADDVLALLDASDLRLAGKKVHLVGWSAGAGVVLRFAMEHPERVASLVLLAPISPAGYGGTKGDASVAPCWPDHAGSGGGTVNPEFIKRLLAKDASDENDASPRTVMNRYYFKPPFRLERSREDLLVAEMLKMAVGEDFYPGDREPSANWPGVAPGRRGMNNAISGKYCDLRRFPEIPTRPPVLWIRGADDQIVSDTSLFDFGFLGKLGAVPGWPGDAVYPPQPMVSQMRAMLDEYRSRGGNAREEVLPGVGHSPHLEAPETFRELLLKFLEAAR
ncbi:alpha/beta fold hydrolase [Myxococcus sp. RHSTA-1-4]|uniref:alpha/beta fold hydrolase n=1 Tax=Myxococcus sp. RHSTA-1-4 TaxID=2874601 RepID=UPI001CBC67D4|nr:alpha/beta hydrolase [Myxococcus sp. RHSTA-1-4]MBZ4419270.1 alpha/beta hydrolase [Myxococcus sp. RHSTA-1-4]